MPAARTRPPRHHCLAVCAPGLEELCAAELTGMGLRLRRRFPGGVEFSASDRELYHVNLWSHVATRVVVRVATFEARSFAELEQGAAGVAWERWVPDGTTPRVRVSSTASVLYHSDAVAERLAVVAGRGPESGSLLVVRLIHNRVTLSVDSSGEPLHRRGWRSDVAKAPLRETLAAAALLASGWDRDAPLVDPFCGSGTIPIEAALLAAGRAPGVGRHFGFEDWPSFQPGTWASVTAATKAPAADAVHRPLIMGTDRDEGAVRAAQANAARAGVADLVDFVHAPLSDMESPAAPRGWLVSNPPYGKRIGGNGDLRDLYARLGDIARARMAGWELALLVADERLARQGRLRWQARLRTTNGGIPVVLLWAQVGADRPSPSGPAPSSEGG